MPVYTAITFAPVQGFIEKSRQLRDLYGASLILSYLSYKVVEEASSRPDTQVISPSGVNVAKGMTNRILIKGEFPQPLAEETILSAWRVILKECRLWIEKKLPNETYCWERDWQLWGAHSWEISWGEGDSIKSAMKQLETLKLSRSWTGVNWIGESSSLTGTDAIAWPGLGSGSRNPKDINWNQEKQAIASFYRSLSSLLEGKKTTEEPEGKFLDKTEHLSIPELVKRMVTRKDIAEAIGMARLEESFSEIARKPDPAKNFTGQWTGWFIGDGDKVGKKLKELSEHPKGDKAITDFSTALRKWGEEFEKTFQETDKLGRVIYAGGDDFLGVIYGDNNRTVTAKDAYDWLMKLKAKWQEHKQPITLSVGFVWAAPLVPQRDVLQHCREAEKIAKKKGRDRLTIRVVFNSGQYVQWTCPWDRLDILTQNSTNWNKAYSDLAHLKSRRAIDLNAQDDAKIDTTIALALLNLYFNNQGEDLLKKREQIVGNLSNKSLLQWINDLILVGWQLCSNT